MFEVLLGGFLDKMSILEEEIVVRQKRKLSRLKIDQAQRFVLLRIPREAITPIYHDPSVPTSRLERFQRVDSEAFQITSVPNIQILPHSSPGRQLMSVMSKITRRDRVDGQTAPVCPALEKNVSHRKLPGTTVEPMPYGWSAPGRHIRS
jgi:hypothetical protein